jgi:anti-sigma B factor antagonist
MQVESTSSDRAVVVRLTGRLNMVAVPQVRAALDHAVRGGDARVVVDLTETSFIDSSGLGALIAGLRSARQSGGDLRIAGVGEQVGTVLRLTNLTRVLKPFPTVEDALDGW